MLYVGLVVHAKTIAVAVAEGGRNGEVRSLVTNANLLEAIRKLVKKLRDQGEIRVCYEPGPKGYCVCWQLTQPSGPVEGIDRSFQIRSRVCRPAG